MMQFSTHLAAFLAKLSTGRPRPLTKTKANQAVAYHRFALQRRIQITLWITRAQAQDRHNRLYSKEYAPTGENGLCKA
jgi:hypothetical protein